MKEDSSLIVVCGGKNVENFEAFDAKNSVFYQEFFLSPQGGYFVWLLLPEGSGEYITKVLVPAAKSVGVRFGIGKR